MEDETIPLDVVMLSLAGYRPTRCYSEHGWGGSNDGKDCRHWARRFAWGDSRWYCQCCASYSRENSVLTCGGTLVPGANLEEAT